MTKFLTPLLTLALLSLGACGGEEPADNGGKGNKGDKGGDTNQSQPADPKAKLAGTWVLENDKIMEMNESVIPDEATPEMKAMMAQMFAQMEMSITLNADGSATSIGKAPNPLGGEAETKNATGSWKLDGDVVTIEMKEDGSDTSEAQDGKIEGDRILMTFTDGPAPMKMSFKRQ